MSEADVGPDLVIWGTNVVVSRCKQKFKQFIEEFVDDTPAGDEITEEIDLTLPLYLQKLQEVSFLEFTRELSTSGNNASLLSPSGQYSGKTIFKLELYSLGNLRPRIISTAVAVSARSDSHFGYGGERNVLRKVSSGGT